MTYENYDEQGEEATPVIAQLRKQLRERDKQIKDLELRLEALPDEVRANVAKEAGILAGLKYHGMPPGLLNEVSQRLDGAEISSESVRLALEAIGFEGLSPEGAAANEPEPAPVADAATVDDALRNVTSLSAQVRSAGATRTMSLEDRIARTQDPTELAALMAQQGLSMDSAGY